MYTHYPFVLEQLPYGYGALEPVISEEIMRLHHDKHQQAYVDNLNKLLSGIPELQEKSLVDLMKSSIEGVKNNAGGVWNHDFFWKSMGQGAQMPKSLSTIFEKEFGGFDTFKEKFEVAAMGRFGSGYAWWVINPDGSTEIFSMANQDNPLGEEKRPLLALDVWEHAYYPDYQNRRLEYIKAWWSVVNWDRVGELAESK